MADINSIIAQGIRTYDPVESQLQIAQSNLASTQAQSAGQQYRMAILGQEARGLLPYVDKPEFGDAWKAAIDRAYAQKALTGQEYSQYRDRPNALVLQSILARSSSMEDYTKLQNQQMSQRVLGEFTGGATPAPAAGPQAAAPAATSLPRMAQGGSYEARIGQMESGGDPNAKNRLSSATGQHQFINETWLDQLKRNRPDIAAGKTDGELLAMRSNPGLSAEMTGTYKRENLQQLSDNGFPANDGTAALAHRFGAGGAMSLLSADPNSMIAPIVGPKVMRANPDLQGKTVGQVIATIAAKAGSQPVQVAEAQTQPITLSDASPAPKMGLTTNQDGSQTYRFQEGGQTFEQMKPAGAGEAQWSRAAPVAPVNPPLPPPRPGPGSSMGPGAANAALPPPTAPIPGPGVGAGAVPTLPAPGQPGQPVANPGAPVAQQAPALPVQAPPAVARPPVAAAVQGQASAPNAVPTPGYGAEGPERLPSARLQAIASAPGMDPHIVKVAENILAQRAKAAELTNDQKEYRQYREEGGTQDSTTWRISKGVQITEEAKQRREAVIGLGKSPDDPLAQIYILTGKWPNADKPAPTAGDRKAIMDAETEAAKVQYTIDALKSARALNHETYTGKLASVRAWLGTNLYDNAVPDFISEPQKAEKTREFANIMSFEAIKSMSETLKGATTDKEMGRFLEIIADSSTPPDIRGRTIQRVLDLAERQQAIYEKRVVELRDGTYFKPGGGGSGPTPNAVDHLRSNPDLAPAFDQKYGAGAAKKALGQ